MNNFQNYLKVLVQSCAWDISISFSTFILCCCCSKHSQSLDDIYASLWSKVILQHWGIITLLNIKNNTKKTTRVVNRIESVIIVQKNHTCCQPDRVCNNCSKLIPIHRWCLKHLKQKKYLSMGNQTFHLLRRMRMYFPQRYWDLYVHDLLLLFLYWNCDLYK